MLVIEQVQGWQLWFAMLTALTRGAFAAVPLRETARAAGVA